MQIYELGYLILPSLAEEKALGVEVAIKNLITKGEGKEIAGEAPFKIDLAYTMTKTIGASRYVVNDAYIGWVKFEMEPENVLKMKAEVDKMDEVLRSMLIKVPKETSFTFAEARKALAEEGNMQEEAPADAVAEDSTVEGVPVADVVE